MHARPVHCCVHTTSPALLVRQVLLLILPAAALCSHLQHRQGGKQAHMCWWALLWAASLPDLLVWVGGVNCPPSLCTYLLLHALWCGGRGERHQTAAGSLRDMQQSQVCVGCSAVVNCVQLWQYNKLQSVHILACCRNHPRLCLAWHNHNSRVVLLVGDTQPSQPNASQHTPAAAPAAGNWAFLKARRIACAVCKCPTSLLAELLPAIFPSAAAAAALPRCCSCSFIRSCDAADSNRWV